MPQINRHALVRHSAKRMYDLVNSVDRYPDWFAWCTASEILHQTDSEMRASLELRVAGIRSSFTTRNLLSPTNRIQLNLEEGAFKYLRGEWIFHALAEDACKVTLQLDFETSSLLAPAFALGFQGLADRMVDDFCRQAVAMTDLIEVEIVYAEPARYWRQVLQLQLNATVRDALEAMDRDRFPANMEIAIDRLAIYGQTAKPDKRLHAHDRIELLRPLIRDPKDTRRLRAAANPLRKPKR